MIDRTICNTCGAVIDGKAQAHIEQTGHAGYTKSVPHKESVLVKKAYDEIVVDQAAYDDTVLTGYKCALCGKTVSGEQLPEQS